MESIMIKWIFTWWNKSNKKEALKWAKKYYNSIMIGINKEDKLKKINNNLKWIKFKLKDLI